VSRYLFDTSTLIDFSTGFSRLLTLIASKETIGVAAISVAECYAGIAPATLAVPAALPRTLQPPTTSRPSLAAQANATVWVRDGAAQLECSPACQPHGAFISHDLR